MNGALEKAMNVTIVKSMDILDLFISNPKLSLHEIIQLSGKPKTSIHRILGSFEAIGFLEKDNEGYYHLGLKLLQLGHLVSERLDVSKISLPYMNQLYKEVEETTMLAILRGNESVVVASVEADQPIKLRSKIGEKTPLYAGSSSRIILAFLSEKEQETYISKTTLEKLATNTILDKDELQQVLKEARENGYTISKSEVGDLTVGLSAPIFNHKNMVIAALTIAGVYTNITDEKIPILVKKIKDAAKEISFKLGYKGPY
jgi:IclR family transcriptional regulator, KDG regulon repressor